MNEQQRRSAYEELLRKHERQLFGYIFSLARNLQDTEDLFQQTAIAMWEKFDQFEQGTNFAAWACTMARFRSLTFIQRNRRGDLSFSEEAHAQLLAVESECEPAPLSDRNLSSRAAMEGTRSNVAHRTSEPALAEERRQRHWP